MKTLKYILAASLLLATSLAAYPQNYIPSEENLAARKEFSRERFGIFLHWGIYASYAQGEWYLNTGELDAGIYSKAASGFYPANYDASAWVKAFKDAGADYVTITSRHHDGFSMFDTKASDYDIVEAYMIFGGIPYYLNYFQKGKSLAQNVDLLLFERNAKLDMEFQRLFGSLFVNPEAYMAAVRLLAKKHIGFTRIELAKSLGVNPGGTFSKMLETLAASDFIESYHPFGQNKKEIRYKLTDPFCRFYLNFIDNQNITDRAFWQHNQNMPSLNAWRGITFEQVCFEHVGQIKRALGVENVASKESAWIVRGDNDHGGTQIDMLIVRDDRVVNLCEMKFLSKEYEPTADDEMKLRARIATLQEQLSFKQVVHLTLVTTVNLKHNAHSGVIQQMVTLGALFA